MPDKTVFNRLVDALREARERGLAASRATPDGGTCNFDSPCLIGSKEINKRVVEAACEQVGISCYYWKFMRAWVIGGCSTGQAAAHTAGAEAAEGVLKKHGFETCMYYQMD